MRVIYVVVEGGVISEVHVNSLIKLKIIDLDSDEIERVEAEYNRMENGVSNSMWTRLI